MYRNTAKYGENLKTFYVGNTNIMKEEEKRIILKKYYDNFEPIDLVKDIYLDNEGLDPLSKMSDVDIQVWLEGDIYLNIDSDNWRKVWTIYTFLVWYEEYFVKR